MAEPVPPSAVRTRRLRGARPSNANPDCAGGDRRLRRDLSNGGRLAPARPHGRVAVLPGDAVLPLAGPGRDDPAAIEVDRRVRQADPDRRLSRRRLAGFDADLRPDRSGPGHHPEDSAPDTHAPAKRLPVRTSPGPLQVLGRLARVLADM